MQLALDDRELDALADALAARIIERLHEQKSSTHEGGYLAPDAAAAYIGVNRKRIYDLKSMGVIEPDGYDGRTPLFTRQTLDAYVLSNGR